MVKVGYELIPEITRTFFASAADNKLRAQEIPIKF